MASTQDLGKVRMVAKGAYNSATNYEADDWVTYQGSSYYCKQNSTGHAPTDTTYWGILASKGDAGASPDITMSATSDGTSSDNPTVSVTKGGTTSNPTYALAFSGLKGGKGDTGDTGDSLTASSVHANDKTTVTIKNARTEATVNTFDVPDGATGNGISTITKTGTSGLVDTYTITYTDGTTTTFTVTNGQDGQGSGDMTKAVYDSAETVANAGGLVAYLTAQLANYYTKSQTYTQTEVNNLISAISTLNIEVVASLPTQDISTTTIYLVPSADPKTQNVKDEYINTDGTSAGWELIGSTAIDLTNYVQKSSTAGLLKNDGTVNTTIEGAVTANTNAISAIKDGQSIDSFGDVESAVKANTKLIKDTVGWSGKNKLPNNRNAIHTEDKLTFSVNSDNSVTINSDGVTTADVYYRFYIDANRIGDSLLKLPNGRYRVVKGVNNNNIKLGIDKRDANGNYIGRYGTATYDNEIVFDYNDAGTYHPEPWVEIESGKTISNVTVYPMLLDADILDLSYEPYFGSTAFPRSEQAVLGAKNIGKYVNKSLSGDGTIGYQLTSGGSSIIASLENNKNYVAQRKSGQGNRFRIILFTNYPTSTPVLTTYQVIFDNTLDEYTFNSGSYNYAVLTYDNASVIAQDTAEAMISLDGGTYAPYAKTNRELTEDVSNIPTVSVTHTGTASSTGVRKQQITVNNVSTDVDGSAYMEQSVTLSTSQSTDVVFTNAIIADGTELTFSSSIWDLVPDDMVTTTGVCTVTLPKWTSAVTIGCRLRVR